MSRIREVIEEWKNSPPYEGVRLGEQGDVDNLSSESLYKIETILEAMEWPQLIIFLYDGTDRVVAPFVIGVSKDGNPLVRGFQLEGLSRSGKVGGWRVFQVQKILNLENHQEYFYPDEFDFERGYPWIYKVFKML